VVAVGILKKEGHPLNFRGWIKIGVPFTVLTTTASAALVWLAYRREIVPLLRKFPGR